MVKEVYRIKPSHAGIVLGKQGRDFKALKEMSGITNLYFDTKTSSHVYTLHVTGVNKAACEAVYNVIQLRIKTREFVIPEVARTFIDVADRSLDTIVLMPCGSGRNEAVMVGERGSKEFEKFMVSSFIRGGKPHDPFDCDQSESSKTKSKFMEFLEKNISTSFQEALDNHKGASNEELDFHISPGKIIFSRPRRGGGGGSCHLLRNEIIGSDGAGYMKQKALKTFFLPYLNPKYIESVNKRLLELQFENLNDSCPETYTTVHLEYFDGSEWANFSVVLAVDENLESLKVTSDPRLSEEKKEVVKRILEAKTIGQVLGVSDSSGNVKTKYFKLSRSVHPDKNSHLGATEASQKLNDAYDKLVNKGYSVSHDALVVENKMNDDSGQPPPPKVVKVKTKKIRMCVVTTLSAKELDFRGSLISYREDKNKLSNRVREAVNLCWEKRDSHGRMPTPSGQHPIKILCTKQVLEGFTWIKEIPFCCGSEETAVLKIKIKKLREKAVDELKWNDCVEIDLKLNCDKQNLSGAVLAKEMIELKKWVERIFF